MENRQHSEKQFEKEKDEFENHIHSNIVNALECQCCLEIITGPVIVVGSHHYHPECFVCKSCKVVIGENEPYILINHSDLYCGNCFKANNTKFEDSAHSIRLIELPSTKNLKISDASIVDSTLQEIRIKNIPILDKSIHVGNRLLEVNGVPVTNSSIMSIEKLINDTKETLRLTVEYDAKTQNAWKEKESLFKKNESIRSAKNKKIESKLHGIGTNIVKGKERSSSMSTLQEFKNSSILSLYDLSRTKSFRMEDKPQRVFRASDLVKGELIGKGFFGQIFKITHKTTGEIMVLKELYRVDEEAQRNFLKEVAVLRSLDHPNVLKFIGVLYKSKNLHLITEFIAGGSLKQLIHNFDITLSYRQRLYFANDIARGMAYLHSRNIIHRDLNSANCLVRDNMSIIVADFGLARIISKKKKNYESERRGLRSSQRRQRYTVVGNPYWMAPEMIKGKIYDEKVDVFSFGIVLCELIGRVQADPDYLPRTSDFGLDKELFIEKFCQNCPKQFYLIAFHCCDLNADNRPPFEILEKWFHYLANGTEAAEEIENTIHSYKTKFETCIPDCISTRIIPKICQPDVSYGFNTFHHDTSDDALEQAKQAPLIINPNDILRSPYLHKDFSPNGDRIKDSIRTRRHNRKLNDENNKVKLTDPDTSESEPMSLLGIEVKENETTEETLHKVKTHLLNYASDLNTLPTNCEKGFVIKVKDGELNINNLQRVDLLSDIETSCETSFNNTDSSIVYEKSLGENNVENQIITETTNKNLGPNKRNVNSVQNRHYVDNKQNIGKSRINSQSTVRNERSTNNKKIPSIKSNKPPVSSKIETLTKNESLLPRNTIVNPQKVHISKRMTQSSKNKIVGNKLGSKLEASLKTNKYGK